MSGDEIRATVVDCWLVDPVDDYVLMAMTQTEEIAAFKDGIRHYETLCRMRLCKNG